MRIIKRMLALALSLLILMMNAAQAEAPFLVYSNGWNLDATPVDVLLSADVETHMPFDDDRLAMLTPIIDLISLRLTTGMDEGKVTISMKDQPLLSLQYRGNAVQLSCLPDSTYLADGDPMSALLGGDVSFDDAYGAFGLSSKGETLVQDGRILLSAFPTVFEAQGKRTKKVMNIAGFGKSEYLIDFTFTAKQLDALKEGLLANCPDGWLREIIETLTFSGKQTVRMYFAEGDVLLRMEYNGSFGPEGDLRTVKLVYKGLHDEDTDKDYIELTSPAKKGSNKNNLEFERAVETNKHGVRTMTGTFKYTATANGVTSIWNGDFALTNAFHENADVIGGEFTIQTKLNGADKYESMTISPELTVAGTADDPTITGCVTFTEKYAGKVTEQAKVSIDLKRAEALTWQETEQIFDLSAMDANDLSAVQSGAAQAIATAVILPVIVEMGPEAEYFFRDLPADAVQSIIDAATPAAR